MDDLASQGYRQRSMETYRKALARLWPELAKVSTATDLLRTIVHLKPATRATYLTVARAFCRWLYESERLPVLLLHDYARVLLDKPAPNPLPSDVERKLERAAFASGACRRTALLYLLMRRAALRIGEARRLVRGDVVLDAGREGLRIREPKGRSDRFVPVLNGRLLRALKRRCEKLEPHDGLLSLPGSPQRPWSYSGARAAWVRLCKRAKLDPVPVPHQCRHSAATDWMRQGMNAEVVRRLLGHRTLQMLAAYVEITNEDIRRELRRKQEDRE